jgi:sulfate-transporting ATPase
MIGVGKVHKPNRQVLKDIYLSFFYGAKIGVLGLNGAGKSTLLHIIAGVDKDYIGQITAQKGITFGFLPQEPELDPAKTVKGIVEEGAQETVNLVTEYEAISAKFAEPDADYDALLEKQGALQERIDQFAARQLIRR